MLLLTKGVSVGLVQCYINSVLVPVIGIVVRVSSYSVIGWSKSNLLLFDNVSCGTLAFYG